MNLVKFNEKYEEEICDFECEDLEEREMKKLLKVWDGVEEVKKYSSKNMYNSLIGSDKMLVLVYGDIGDGHGDMINYILSRNNNLYVVNDCSNGNSISKIVSYDDYKDCVSRDELWSEMYLEDCDKVKFKSSLFSFYDDDVVLNSIYDCIDKKGEVEWDEEKDDNNEVVYFEEYNDDGCYCMIRDEYCIE